MEAAPPSTGYWDHANHRLIVYNRAGKPWAIDPLFEMYAAVKRRRRADEEHAAAVAAGLRPPPATPHAYTSLPYDCYHLEDQSAHIRRKHDPTSFLGDKTHRDSFVGHLRLDMFVMPEFKEFGDETRSGFPFLEDSGHYEYVRFYVPSPPTHSPTFLCGTELCPRVAFFYPPWGNEYIVNMRPGGGSGFALVKVELPQSQMED